MPSTIPYSTGDWDDERLGNHRAVLQVNQPAAAVRVSIPGAGATARLREWL